MYYILSLKYSTQDNIMWWGPNNQGYTVVLDRAGVYPHEAIEGHRSYYDDGVDTMAVSCLEAERLAVRIVPNDGKQREALKAARFVGEMAIERPY